MKAELADLSFRGQTLLQEAHDGCRRNFARLLVAPALVLRVPRREPALRQHDAVRDADQIHVGEQHRSEEHTSELQSLAYLVCRLLLEKKKKKNIRTQKLNQVHERIPNRPSPLISYAT